MITPAKLQPGDEIRIIAPSRSLKILSEDGIAQSKEALEALGFVVTFGKNVEVDDLHGSSSIEERIEDLHAAFADKNVKGILTVIGGFNSNELLPYIDYELLRANPKVLCGFSDITAISTAITAKSGFVTYSGPHFSSFGMMGLQEYQTTYFKNCVMNDQSYDVQPPSHWSDDAWFLDQENRVYEEVQWQVYTEGEATGTIYGGNLCTLNLLQGTEYMPDLTDCILFLEDDELTCPETFARDLTSLLQVTNGLQGLVIGRFQRASKLTQEHLHFILDKHPQLQNIPVMYDADFGHTQPKFTFPIGGIARIATADKKIEMLTF